MSQKILFYTDPHLGMRRKAHSTIGSTMAREAWVLEHLTGLVNSHSEDTVVCLGDFFDTTANPEEVILSAAPIASRTNLILAGNHDVHNREGRASSLTLLDHFMPNKVIIDDYSGESPGVAVDIGRSTLFLAPHALDQESFDASIGALVAEAKTSDSYRVLCLHCNYALPEEFATGNTLHLTKSRAAELLSVFHYILIGHIHTPLDDPEMGGRVKVIGSTYPTAFDNMEDKRALLYDPDAGTFTDVRTWSKEEQYWEGPISAVSEAPESAKYFFLTDDGNPGEAHACVVRLFDQGAFMVKLATGAADKGDDLPKLDTISGIEDLPTLIGRELEALDPDLAGIWKRLSNGSASE